MSWHYNLTEAPHTISAKLTNASPRIIFATVGLIIGFAVVLPRPVSYEIEKDGEYLSPLPPEGREWKKKRRGGGSRLGI
jgi:hypothetical protein